MNNKGFTLIELLLTIVLVSVVMIIFMVNISDTFGLSSEKSYEILKKSIITQVKEYIYECDNGLINCKNDYTWQNIGNSKETSFYLGVMKKYSYFNKQDYINPETQEEISNCLIIDIIKDELATINVSLDDSKCKK